MGKLNLKSLASWFSAGIVALSLSATATTNTFDNVKANKLNVDNLQLDGNTLSSTDTNGNIVIDANGTGGTQFTDLTATTVPYLNGSKILTSSAVTPTQLGYLGVVSSNLCGINDSCTMTNKTLTGPVIDVVNLTEQSSSPSSPSAGTKKLYAKNDGKVYTKNSAGSEVEVGAGVAGGVNLVLDGEFSSSSGVAAGTTLDASGITSWISGTAGAGPLNDGYLRIDATSSAQIVYVKMKPNPTGFAFSNCEVNLRYQSNDQLYKMYVYDSTNSKKVSAEKTIDTSAIGGSFLMSIPYPCGDALTVNNLAIESTSSSAAILNVDNIRSGEPISTAVSTISTEWQDAGALVITATTTAPTKPSGIVRDKVQWRRVGGNAEIMYQYEQSNTTSATAGTGDYLIAIPSAIGVIDTSKVSVVTTAYGSNTNWKINSRVGQVNSTLAAGSNAEGPVSVYDSTHLRFHWIGSDTTANSFPSTWSAGNGALNSGSTITVSAVVNVPIQGWSTGTSIRADQTNYGWKNTNLTTSDFTGFGTVSNIECQDKRDGEDLLFRCKFTCGTPTATEARVNFSAGGILTSADTGKIPSIQIGEMGGNSSSGASTVLTSLIEPSKAYITLGYRVSGTSGAFAKYNGNAACLSGDTLMLKARIPIQGWSDNGKAPQLVNSVVSTYTGVKLEAEGRMTCSSSASITYNENGWLSSIGNISSGQCAVVMVNPGWTSAPYCYVNNKTSGGTTVRFDVTATTAATAACFDYNGSNCTSFDFTVLCRGNK